LAAAGRGYIAVAYKVGIAIGVRDEGRLKFVGYSPVGLQPSLLGDLPLPHLEAS